MTIRSSSPSLTRARARTAAERFRGVVPTLIGTFGTQAAILVAGVLAARALGVEDRGYQALFVVITAVLGQIASLGVPIALTYWIAQTPNATARLIKLVTPLLASQCVIGLVLNVVIVLTVTRNDPHYVRTAGLIGCVITPFYVGNGVTIGVLQGLRRFRALSAFRLLTPCAYALSLLIAYLLSNPSLETVMLLWTGATAIAFVIGCLVLWQAVRNAPRAGSVDLPQRASIVRFGLKGVLGTVSPLEAFRLDQAVVGLVLSPIALGLYTSAVAFTNLPRLSAQAIGVVGLPYIAAQRQIDAKVAGVRRFWLAGTALAAAIALVIFLLAGWLVPFLFGAAFSGAVGLTRVLLVGAACASSRRALSDAVTGAGFPAIGSQGEVVSWVALGVGLLALVGPFGVYGVAWALVLSSASALLYAGFRARRVLRAKG